MHPSIENKDKDKLIKSKWTLKEKDQNICNEKIKDGKKLKISLPIKNKDNIGKRILK